VTCPRPAAFLLGALLGCAGAGGAARGELERPFHDVQASLAARAASLAGHTGDFRLGGERFGPDCTGFVQAVYEAEGIPLRTLMRRAAPSERIGVAAAFRAMESYGVVFGGGGRWPEPGDLVFWHDTYDRNRNGRRDDRFTHVGIVEYVADDGTIVFVHRGGRAVARGAMNPQRPGEASASGVILNSPLRSKTPRASGVPVLAGALFAAYGRIDPEKVRRSLAGDER
jgi:hypothetical protein